LLFPDPVKEAPKPEPITDPKLISKIAAKYQLPMGKIINSKLKL